MPISARPGASARVAAVGRSPSPTATRTQISIERRFNGPLASANGGYACGRVARFVDGPAEVTLRRPIPLETPLDVERHDDGRVTLHHDGVLLATGEPALPLDFEPPCRPSVAEARDAVRAAWTDRPAVFADCFVCAPDRPDGLGVAFGALPADPSMTAALLIADAGVPHEGGCIAPEIAWAALDCPGFAPPLWNKATPSLLARMTAEQLESIELAPPVIAIG